MDGIVQVKGVLHPRPCNSGPVSRCRADGDQGQQPEDLDGADQEHQGEQYAGTQRRRFPAEKVEGEDQRDAGRSRSPP